MSRPPFPPFDEASASIKVRAAENAWNGRDPDAVSLAYTPDSQWRNRDQFLTRREAIRAFLADKWRRELDYKLIKELWAFTETRCASPTNGMTKPVAGSVRTATKTGNSPRTG
jgi:nuclear transport factor 2 (NTF2) superfamily protein